MTVFRFAVMAAFMVLGGLAAGQVVQAQNGPDKQSERVNGASNVLESRPFYFGENDASSVSSSPKVSAPASSHSPEQGFQSNQIDLSNYNTIDNNQESGAEREYSDLERRIAREVIATGRMLEGDPRLQDVVRTLATRGADMLPVRGPRLGLWVERQLQELIPKTGNDMADAALIAAGREMAGTAGKSAGSLMDDVRRIPFDRDLEVNTEGMDSAITRGLMRSLAEGGRAAAHESDIYALANLEFDYTLGEGGFDEYSLLTVQPFYESASLRHNIFAQASYSNREVEDLGADTRSHRDTLNAGLGYRYITPDEQHMFGVNAFVDHEFDFNHNRMSVGLDYKNALFGAHLNRYLGLSDWRGRGDGFEEKALSGTDLELSGRLPQFPELELFARGFKWEQERTPFIEPDGNDIWGYEVSAEYTPVNIFTLRGAAIKDNTMDDVSAEITFRLNHTFGDDIEELWRAPDHNLTSVLDRRFEKVRRQNDIRVQVRQDADFTARVIDAQGANVTAGQRIPFGTVVTTGGALGDFATLEFGNGATLDLGQNTEVLIEADTITFNDGSTASFTSGDGTPQTLDTPGETITLLGTDVDLRVSGGTTTLRVRDGAADFTDDTGTKRVNSQELAESVAGDAVIPQIITFGDANFDPHVSAALTELILTGPSIATTNAAPAAAGPVSIAGTFEVNETLTFTVPLTKAATVTGTPELEIMVGSNPQDAIFTGGSGTNTLTFTYTLQSVDGGESNVSVNRLTFPAGATIATSDGKAVVPEQAGTRSGVILGGAPTLDSSMPADDAVDVAVGADIVLTFNENVVAGTGDIEITDLSNGTDDRTIPIGDAQVTIGTNTVTIDPSSDLAESTEYEITIAGTDVIEDTDGNAFAGITSPDLTFTTEDNTAPVLQSFTRQNPTVETTNADELVFRATFNEPVQNVDAGDFDVTGTTTTIDTVSDAGGGTQWDITITDSNPGTATDGDLGNLDGTVDLDLAVGQNIADTAGNALPGTQPATEETYTLDNTAPTVTAITATNASDGSPGPFVTNDVITITLDASEDLVQTGSPTLTLDIGGNTETAAFDKINGSGDAEFTYPVVSGDQDTDGFEVTAINVNPPGQLTDAIGNDLDISSFSLPENTGEDVNPVILGQPSCPSGDLTPSASTVGCARVFDTPINENNVGIYAGDVPGSTTDFFVARCDESTDGSTDFVDPATGCGDTGDNSGGPNSFQWNISDLLTIPQVGGIDPTLERAVNGPLNTSDIVAASGSHPAGEQCNNRSPMGTWYFPAISELDIIYSNLAEGEQSANDDTDNPVMSIGDGASDSGDLDGPLVDSFNTGGGEPSRYWSSTERNNLNTWDQRFNNGHQVGLNNRTNFRPVRCARRDP